MLTSLAIDHDLLAQAKRAGGYKTKRETVNEALREFIRRRERKELTRLFGKITYDRRYEHKQDRRRR